MKMQFLLLGYAECSVCAAQAARFLNVCRTHGLVYTPLRGEDGQDTLAFRCRLTRLPSLLAACKAAGVSVDVRRRGGLPMLFVRYRRRVGFLVGALLAVLTVFVASNVVWDVRVEGDGDVRLPSLYDQLGACGLSVGNWIPALDTDEIESRLLTASGEVAWVSVNIKGTVAYVQVRELMTPQSAKSDAPTNLVARCDGVVESVKLLSGQAVVKTGDVVRKGELLVAGVRDSGAYGYQIGAAQGEVLARTEHTLTVRLPRVSEEKVAVGQKNIEKTLFFFGKAIKVTKSTGIMPDSCDTIKKLKIWSLPTGVALPISVETTVARIYRWQQVTLSDEELYERAYEQLQRELTLATKDATLLYKSVSSTVTDEGILLTCQYRCVENIAQALPFDTQSTAADK